MRVFIAVKLDEAIKMEIAEISAGIEKACGSGKYADSANYHITLEFIGEVEPGQLMEIKRVMDDVASRSKSFEARIEGIGRFEKGRSAIVWIGVSRGESELSELNGKLRRGLSEIGIGSDGKKFNPHITLGRKVICDPCLKGIESGKWTQRIDGIVLMESARIKGKLMYTPIYESGFEG